MRLGVIRVRSVEYNNLDKMSVPCAVVTLGDKKNGKRDVKEMMEEIVNFQILKPYFQNDTPSDPADFQNHKPYFQINEGLVLEGDWENYPLQLVEIMEFVKDHKLILVMGIHTNFSTLEYNLGVACSEQTFAKEQIDKNILTHSDKKVYNFIGAMMLDYYLQGEYYIKVGKFLQKKPSDVIQFGIRVDSRNQYIIKMEKREDEVNENPIN